MPSRVRGPVLRAAFARFAASFRAETGLRAAFSGGEPPLPDAGPKLFETDSPDDGAPSPLFRSTDMSGLPPVQRPA
jgi:hypothetical protein